MGSADITTVCHQCGVLLTPHGHCPRTTLFGR
jgi:hypothetical protein